MRLMQLYIKNRDVIYRMSFQVLLRELLKADTVFYDKMVAFVKEKQQEDEARDKRQMNLFWSKYGRKQMAKTKACYFLQMKIGHKSSDLGNTNNQGANS
jgi:hypothetical protein